MSLDGLAKRLVSAGVGTTSEQALHQHLPNAIPAEPSAKGASSLERLLIREVDALVMDAPDALDYGRERPLEVRVLEQPLAEERYIIAVRPNAVDLLKRIDAAILKMKSDGSLHELDRRFGLEPGGE